MCPYSELSTALMAWNCDHCDGLEYYDRMRVFEILDLNDVIGEAIHEAIREAIVYRKSEAGSHAIAIENGMLTFSDDGLDKIKTDTTFIDKVMWIIEY
jgi:type II secretory ATPase GspE/PulE/Tfp pilus assembly ATPase PilB-like protein